ASALRVYPNPANTNVTIELKENDYSLIIYNVAGVAVKRLKVSDKQVEIDTRLLASGIYFVVATTKNGVTQMEKLIINK
nr:T9SS type A sorting domain-containing protein [Bacteroidales bacterium]